MSAVRKTLQQRLRDMRPSEAEVTRRLLRHLPVVAEKSLRDVAAWCQTSDATVMRACRAAGFEGFQELKYHVLRELTAGGLKPAAVVSDSYAEDLRASQAAVRGGLAAAAHLIRTARRVVLAGVGASYGVSWIATDILFTLGKQALPVRDPQMASFALTPPVSGLVALAISHSGETRLPIQLAKEARQAGVKCIGLTNEPGSELAKTVDVLLATQVVEPSRGSYAIGPRLCQLAVLDSLFSLASVHRTAQPKPRPGVGGDDR